MTSKDCGAGSLPLPSGLDRVSGASRPQIQGPGLGFTVSGLGFRL